MSASLVFLATLAAAAQASDDPIFLDSGEAQGAIDAQAVEVRTRVLGGRGYTGRNPGRRYLFTPEHGGEFTFQLESSDFDAYLVLRDRDGAVLAEDDDGFILPDAQIVAQLEEGQDYLVDAVAVHGLTGSFLLRVLEGRPPAMTPETRNELALERLRSRLEEDQRTLGPEHPRYAARLELLATRLWWSGEYAEFVELLRPVLELCEELRGPDHPDTARCLKHLADGLARIGQLAEAESMQRRALAIRERALGLDDPATLDSLEGLALLLLSLGRDEEANAYLLKARAASRATAAGDDDARTDTLCGLAWYLYRRNRYEEAEHYYRLALGDGPINPDLRFDPFPLIGLARCLLARGQNEEAEARLLQARAILEKEWGSQHSCWPDLLDCLATTAQRRGDLERACQLQTQALERTRVALGPEHPITAFRCGQLAWVLARLGRAEEAERLYSEALEIYTRSLGAEHSRTLVMQCKLATARLDLGRADEAWLLARESTELAQQSLERSFEAASELDRFFHAADQRSRVNALISCTAEVPTEEHEWANFDALLAWKGIVFRTLSRSRNSTSGADPALREELSSVRLALSDLLWGDTLGDPTATADTISELRERREKLESRIAQAASDRRPAALGARALQAALPPAAAWVDFHIGACYRPLRRDGDRLIPGAWLADQVTAWVLRPDRPVKRIDLGSASVLQQAVTEHLSRLSVQRGAPVDAADAGRDPGLSRLLWRPLEEHLDGAELVLLSPDGFLGALPFETLGAESGSYLIEPHAFVYVEDVATLLDKPPTGRRPEPGSVLALGAVDFDAVAAHDQRPLEPAPDATGALRSGLSSLWLPLPETAREAEAVAHLARQWIEPDPDILVLRGSEATKARLQKAITGRDVVHLATHGFFQPEGVSSTWDQARDAQAAEELGLADQRRLLGQAFPGMLCGLVLAGANVRAPERAEEGLLTADEVGWMDLDGCSLVVLSACETALGATRGGEGMLSLRRAFHQAGARNVVSSLWRVGDEDTVELMTDFYRRLWELRQGPVEALRGARLQMLQRNRARYQGQGRPSSWGAFVLSGDWR